MNENYMPPSPEELKQQQEEDEERQYQEYMEAHPDIVIPPEQRRECGPEVAELEGMFESFKAEHSLEELLQVIDLTPQEAPNHPIREPARIALIDIVQKLNIIEEQTNITIQNNGMN